MKTNDTHPPETAKEAPTGEGSVSTSCSALPDWVGELDTVEMSDTEVADLAEYSLSLPDSYKRPIAQGGRPWKRDLNVYSHFAPKGEKIWIYCEYVPHENPELLGILNKRIIPKQNAVGQSPTAESKDTNQNRPSK